MRKLFLKLLGKCDHNFTDWVKIKANIYNVKEKKQITLITEYSYCRKCNKFKVRPA